MVADHPNHPPPPRRTEKGLSDSLEAHSMECLLGVIRVYAKIHGLTAAQMREVVNVGIAECAKAGLQPWSESL